MKHGHLTNEYLSSQYENTFELAANAIHIAQLLIACGRDVSAPQLLDEMARNPGKFNIARLEEEVKKAKERQHEPE